MAPPTRPVGPPQADGGRRTADAEYGDGVNNAAVQRAGASAKSAPQNAQPQQGGFIPPPGSMGPLDAPSARPDEPLTAGLPIGEGPGPTQMPGAVDDSLWELRALAQKYPNRDLLRMVALAESRM